MKFKWFGRVLFLGREVDVKVLFKNWREVLVLDFVSVFVGDIRIVGYWLVLCFTICLEKIKKEI